MATVAITGVGGLIGRRLVAELTADPAVERIVGIDIRAPEGLHSPKLEFRRADIRDPGFEQVLSGADTLVHLAFQLDPIRDEAEMRSINVDGTRNVIEAAVAAGIRRIIYTSSGVVYGAHPDNDLPLTEDSPLRANPDFNYAEHKLEVEQWLWPWAERHPEVVLTVFRPAIVGGPGVQNFITRQLEAPRFVVVRGHYPPMQFVHVDDVAAALALAVDRDLPGAYNVASEGWLSHDEVVAISGVRTVEVPEEVAFRLAERLWRLGLAEAPPGELYYIMYPWVMSVDKLLSAGWRPKHTNRDTLAELAEEHRPYVTVLGVRARRRDLRVGAAALASVAGLLTARRLRRR